MRYLLHGPVGRAFDAAFWVEGGELRSQMLTPSPGSLPAMVALHSSKGPDASWYEVFEQLADTERGGPDIWWPVDAGSLDQALGEG